MSYNFRNFRNLVKSIIMPYFPTFNEKALGIPNLKEEPLVRYDEKSKKLETVLFFMENRLPKEKMPLNQVYRRLNYNLSEKIKLFGNKSLLYTDIIKEKPKTIFGGKIVYSDGNFIKYYNASSGIFYEVTLYISIDLRNFSFSDKDTNNKSSFKKLLEYNSECLIDCNCMDFHFSGKRRYATELGLSYYKTFIRYNKKPKSVLCKHMRNSFIGLFNVGEENLINFLLNKLSDYFV